MITVFVAVFQQQHKEIKPNDLVTLPHRRSTSFSRNLPTLFSKYNNRPSNKQKNKTIATQITRYRNTEKKQTYTNKTNEQKTEKKKHTKTKRKQDRAQKQKQRQTNKKPNKYTLTAYYLRNALLTPNQPSQGRKYIPR